MHGLQVECRLIGVASEDDGSTTVEGEVLGEDVLDGDVVGAVVDGVGAEHVEGTFIMIGGADGAVAVEGDIVVGAGIHQQLEGGVGCGVDQEVEVDVGFVLWSVECGVWSEITLKGVGWISLEGVGWGRFC